MTPPAILRPSALTLPHPYLTLTYLPSHLRRRERGAHVSEARLRQAADTLRDLGQPTLYDCELGVKLLASLLLVGQLYEELVSAERGHERAKRSDLTQVGSTGALRWVPYICGMRVECGSRIW